MAKVSLSVIKADVGGYVGHSSTHPQLIAATEDQLNDAVDKELIEDFYVGSIGDDINLILSHRQGVDEEAIHSLAWSCFQAATEEAESLGLYGAGQDLLSDAFSGNVRGLGPGAAEMEFEVRPSEPFIVFMADKTEPGAWNLPLYRIFADPFNTAGLVIDPKLHAGFDFEVWDLEEDQKIRLHLPEETYDLLAFIGAPERYVINAVYSRYFDTIAASSTTDRLSLIAGEYVGKDDPALIVRCQAGLPAVGEVLEAFTKPHLVGGWMRGSHTGPLLPVSFNDRATSRFDGPPRVAAYGFQLKDGKLIGPRDMFADVAFDRAREKALEIADYMRQQGPFEPHRLPLEAMEYTTMPSIMETLSHRFEPTAKDSTGLEELGSGDGKVDGHDQMKGQIEKLS